MMSEISISCLKQWLVVWDIANIQTRSNEWLLRVLSREQCIFAVFSTSFADAVLCLFLNQTRAGRRPARVWFLEIAFVREVSMRVCMCVCVCVDVCVCVRPRGHK